MRSLWMNEIFLPQLTPLFTLGPLRSFPAATPTHDLLGFHKATFFFSPSVYMPGC